MESPEYKAWEECYPKLKQSITLSPSDIETQLRPLCILTEGDKQFLANVAHDNDQKAKRIADVIQGVLKEDPTRYKNIFEALKAAGPWIYKTLERCKD